ncbi:MAG: ABC transporter ATP-binding protein [Candidatus Hydrogenedentes bacterium]|jgi:putative ABC transport system ATP-binding protein|nr:ABC transporter ATP-binding protein [Candidatus Hydrogenedentota bacterium]
MAIAPRRAAGPHGSPIFQIDSLVKEYVMGEVIVSALRGVSLEVKQGEFLIILGPSGSGKSTLLNIVGGLDSSTSGDVWFRDENLSVFNEREFTLYRRDHIGFIFQFYNLMPNLTARENVEMATEISANPMGPMEALGLVELTGRADHFPSQLSGGEQQRVAIARAIAKRPEILLCDEPTGALDVATGKIVLNALKAVNERVDTTVIVITHNASIGSLGDRVIRMMDGGVRKIVENEQRVPVDEVDW